LLSIENVVGSAFDDKLTGSSLANRLDGGAGADMLNGRAGDDTLIGGAGDDRFVFACGDVRDVVADFVAGDSSGDVIDLRGYGITSFAELDARMSQVGSDVVIVLDADDRITLQNVSEGSLDAADFAFASASPFAEWLRLFEGAWGIGWVFRLAARRCGHGRHHRGAGGMLNEITRSTPHGSAGARCRRALRNSCWSSAIAVTGENEKSINFFLIHSRATRCSRRDR
jgi:hypothetical protein